MKRRSSRFIHPTNKASELTPEQLKSASINWFRQNIKLPDSVDSDAAQQIVTFLYYLKKEVPIRQIVLFGSCATGKNHSWSDIDLAIISRKFLNYSIHARKAALLRVVNKAGTYSIQPYGISTPEWFSNKTHGFINIIKQSGIMIFESKSQKKRKERYK